MEHRNNTGRNVGIGVAAAAAAAAAAAGAYWFYGSADAAKHRKQVKSFMLKARADVLSAVEKAKDIDKEKYYAIVEKVIARYSGVAGVTAAEITQMGRDLKNAWIHMKAARDTASSAAPAKKAAKKTAKKSAPKKKTS